MSYLFQPAPSQWSHLRPAPDSNDLPIAATAAGRVGGDHLHFAEEVGDGAQLRLDRVRGRATDLRGGLRARATEE